MYMLLQQVQVLVDHKLAKDNPGLIFTNFVDKDDYLINARAAVANYKPYFVGTAKKELDREQLRATCMATILNSIGLWSSHWAHFFLRPQHSKSRTSQLLRPQQHSKLSCSLIIQFQTCTRLAGSRTTSRGFFSSLRYIFNYLRLTMTEKRLNHCLLLHNHKELTDPLHLRAIAQEFVSRKMKKRNTSESSNSCFFL